MRSPTPTAAKKSGGDAGEYITNKFNLKAVQKISEINGVNRTIATQLLAELGYKTGAEIGVAQGHHAEMICQNNPQAKLYAVDIWEPYEGYVEYTDRINKYYREAQERLKTYNCELIKKFSQDAAQDFEDGSLDFVYIDGAHDLENAIIDLCEWSKKVRPGGIVFGHDYTSGMSNTGALYGVKDAVQAFVNVYNVNRLFVLTNDLRDPKFGKDSPGWLFVRTEEDLI